MKVRRKLVRNSGLIHWTDRTLCSTNGKRPDRWCKSPAVHVHSTVPEVLVAILVCVSFLSCRRTDTCLACAIEASMHTDCLRSGLEGRKDPARPGPKSVATRSLATCRQIWEGQLTHKLRDTVHHSVGGKVAGIPLRICPLSST